VSWKHGVRSSIDTDGKILQRNFGGHRYPRLAHVGDRTGLEMIRTLQDHGIHLGLDVFMEHTVVTLLKDGDRIAGAFGYEPGSAGDSIYSAPKAVVLATGGIGRAYKITQQLGVYGRRPLPCLSRWGGADGYGICSIPSHRNDLAAQRSRILVTEGVRGEGGVLRNKDGKRFMFDEIPLPYVSQTADSEEEGWRYTQGDKNARRPPNY